MKRALLTKSAQRRQRVERAPLEGVGARAVGDEDDYRHTAGDGVMRRRKAGREETGKSRALRSLARARLTRLHSPHGNSKAQLDHYEQAGGGAIGRAVALAGCFHAQGGEEESLATHRQR